VVHFDPPADHTDYVHRSGRTGRAGRTGTVVSLVTDEQRKDMHSVQRALGLEPGLLAPFSTPMASTVTNHRADSKSKSKTATEPGTMVGTVKFFNGARGYGFLAREGGEDLFVHHSQIEGDERQGLAEGSTVEFTIAPGRKGEEARNVKVI
jgi:CspA family cold shock protein